MIIVPFQINAREFDLFVCLEESSIERIRAYDPAVVDISKIPERYSRLRLHALIIAYGTADDLAALEQASGKMAIDEALQPFFRGYRVLPGDHDGPYLSISTVRGTERLN